MGCLKKQPAPANTVSSGLKKAAKKPPHNNTKPYTSAGSCPPPRPKRCKVQAACIWSDDRSQLREPAIQVALHALNPHAFTLFENVRFEFAA